MKLGKLTEVNVRDLWKHEQYDFSAWLAKEENITELGDVIGLNLVQMQKLLCGLLRKQEKNTEVQQSG